MIRRNLSSHRIALTFTLTIVLAACLAERNACAGPWSKAPGHFLYAKLAQTIFSGSSFSQPDGTTYDAASNLTLLTSIYAEIGLLRGLQLSASLPFFYGCNKVTELSDSTCRAAGGDGIVALQYQLGSYIPQPLVVAVRADAKIPLYKSRDRGEPFETPAAGDGQLDFTLWLSVGGSLSSIPLYGFVELGYRFRTEVFFGDELTIGTGANAPTPGFVDSVVMTSQIGYTFFRKLIVGANFQMVLAVKDSDTTKEYITVGPFAYLRVWKGLAIEAAFDPMVYAHVSIKGYGLTIGASYQY